MQKTISVFGLGYVGCVSAACFANAGYNVIGVDVNADKVDMINAGTSPIVEPGLAPLISDMVLSGRLRATTSCAEAIAGSDLAFICVGTPGNRNGQVGFQALDRVCWEIGMALREKEQAFTVVVRSTVLPGTTSGLVMKALLRGAGSNTRPLLRVAMNPEFIREGSALQDFAHPAFTLVGCESREIATMLQQLYSFVQAPFVHTELKTAETVKYVSNAYHALKVCFANEIGDVCNALGSDAQEVMRIFRMDDKLNISKAYLKPGFAFGGSCLPKDIKALLYAVHHADVALPLLDSIMPSNQAQVKQGIDAVLATGKKRIGVFGLAFKPDTDDLRESPMVTLVEALIGKGLDVRIYDRNVAIARLVGANRNYIVEEIPHISQLMCDSTSQLIEHADVLVIGSDDKDAQELLEMAGSRHVIVDLTRGALKPVARARSKAA